MVNKKAYILYVLKVLQEHSDDHHPLTHQQIIDYVKKEYNVKMERKAVANCISILSGEPFNYDINKSIGGKGFSLDSRDFDPTDILYMNTYLLSARNIPANFAKRISTILLNNLSEYYRANFHQICYMDKVDRTQNKQLPYVIDAISHAIRHNKEISFKYTEYVADGTLVERKDKDGKVKIYNLSPYYLVNSHGTFYLLGLLKHKDQTKNSDLTAFRVEFIKEVVESTHSREKISNLPGYKNFDFGEFFNTHPYITGDNTSITMKTEVLNPKNGIRYIKDWFGNSAKIEEKNGKCISTIKTTLSPAFWWIMQYSEHYNLLGPKELIKKTKDAAKRILDTY